jgi:transposase InsO family protein
MDFVSDCLAGGRPIRAADPSSREMRVQYCYSQARPARDNGPEFRGHVMAGWSEERRVRLHIEPGKPMHNAYIESFNGPLREEHLNANWLVCTEPQLGAVQ